MSLHATTTDGIRRLRDRIGRRGGFVILGGALALTTGVTALRPSVPDAARLAVVREAAFEDVLVESGTVDAERLMLYGSTIAGASVKIAELAAEGTTVRTGDLLIRFDGTAFEQERARESAALRQAEADRQRAREEGRLERLHGDQEREQARQELDAATRALADETNGEGAVKLAEAEAAAAEANRDVQRTKTAYDDLRPLLAQGFITRAELERAEQAWRRAQEQQRLAAMKARAIREYGRPAAIDRARAGVQGARDGLARQREAAAARTAQQRAAEQQAQARVDEIRAKIAIIDDRLARLSVRAQAPGLVVYRDLFFGSDRRKPQAGDEVLPNQPIIAVPDSHQLVVETQVREGDLHRIAVGQPVTVRVDAYPDLRLRAAVALIGALAGRDPSRSAAKTFPVTIRLRDTDARLRTGMTARVDVEVARAARATLVPLQAVFGERDRPYAIVRAGRGPERRALRLGADNGVDAVVRSGVRAGDVVLLGEPGRTP